MIKKTWESDLLCVFASLREAFLVLVGIAILFVASAVGAELPWAVPVDGDALRVEIVGVDANWRVALHDGERQRTITAADLVKWGRCPEQGRGGALVLADGSLLAAEVTGVDGQSVTAESDSLGTVKVPLDAIAGMMFRSPPDTQRRDVLIDRLARQAAARPLAGEGQGVRAAGDRLLLLNGDELHGLLTGISEGIVRWKSDAGPVEIEADRVAVVSFDPSFCPARGETAGCGLMSWVGVADGSRLLASRLLIEGDRATITAAGQSFAASRRDLVFLQPVGGRGTYLSDMKPVEYQQTPFLGDSPLPPWPYRNDRNVSGGLLRAGGRLYLKGLGVHSAARLVYELGREDKKAPRRHGGQGDGSGKAEGERENGEETGSPRPLAGEGSGVRARGAVKRFEALVAIDDSTAGRGSVWFRVLVDGREKFASPIVRGGDRPLPVSVNLTGAKRLELIVDYADHADVLDHADWLDARITQ